MNRILLLVILFTHAFIAAEGILLARSETFLTLEKEAKAETADDAEICSFKTTLPAAQSEENIFYIQPRPVPYQGLMVSAEARALSVPFFILHGGLRT